jgi:CheY-like chemotaxis protein
MDTPLPQQEHSFTVLVVDDDNELRELLSTELELEGHKVVTANNGLEGVDKARTLKPDLILMDIMMPEMDGIEATMILKEDEYTKYIPIIMVTSIDKKDDMAKGFEAGATDYVTKPFFLPELKARINATLRLKNIYNDLTSIREHLIKEQMLRNIRETTYIVQDTVETNFTIILDKLNNIFQSQQYLSQDDLNTIANSANNIKSSVDNLGSLDSFAVKIYETISEIADKIQ